MHTQIHEHNQEDDITPFKVARNKYPITYTNNDKSLHVDLCPTIYWIMHS